MYDSFIRFLRDFSADSPLLWALLIVAVVACAGLALYVFWELALRWASFIFSPRHRDREDRQV